MERRPITKSKELIGYDEVSVKVNCQENSESQRREGPKWSKSAKEWHPKEGQQRTKKPKNANKSEIRKGKYLEIMESNRIILSLGHQVNNICIWQIPIAVIFHEIALSPFAILRVRRLSNFKCVQIRLGVIWNSERRFVSSGSKS
jgi:hypothetical protein